MWYYEQLVGGYRTKEISLLDFEDTIKGKISDTDIKKRYEF